VSESRAIANVVFVDEMGSPIGQWTERYTERRDLNSSKNVRLFFLHEIQTPSIIILRSPSPSPRASTAVINNE